MPAEWVGRQGVPGLGRTDRCTCGGTSLRSVVVPGQALGRCPARGSVGSVLASRWACWTVDERISGAMTGVQTLALRDTNRVPVNAGRPTRADPGVCHRRTESNGEPLTCEKNLIGSCYVRGRLNTLAPISGSHSIWSAGADQGARSTWAARSSVPIRSLLRGRGQLANQSSRDVRADGEWPPVWRPTPGTRKRPSGLSRYRSPGNRTCR